MTNEEPAAGEKKWIENDDTSNCGDGYHIVGCAHSKSPSQEKPEWEERLVGVEAGIQHVDGAEYNIHEDRLVAFVRNLLTSTTASAYERGYKDGWKQGITDEEKATEFRALKDTPNDPRA